MCKANFKNIILLSVVILSFFSCNKESGNSPVVTLNNKERKVLVVCEGSYGNGNAALDLYQPNVDSFFQNVYQATNGKSLGDIFQSVQKIGNNYYLCVNNSDKVIVVDSTFKLITYINVPKPRYIVAATNNKAYVSSLYHNQVYVINPATNVLSDSIAFPATNTEGLLKFNNNIFVCTWDTSINKLYAINTDNDKIADSFDLVGYAPQEVLMDKEEKLWVLAGNVQKGKSSTWTRLDPYSHQILKSFSFSSDVDPIRPVMNAAKDSIYFIEANYSLSTDNNGIYRMSINAADLPSSAFIQAQQNQYFGGLGIDPISGDIYVGDPKGFVQKGSVSIYTVDGSLKKQFNTGVGPGHFYFAE